MSFSKSVISHSDALQPHTRDKKSGSKSVISISLLPFLFGRFDIHIGNHSPFWNLFSRTSLRNSWAKQRYLELFMHFQQCMYQVVFAQLLGLLFVDQSETGQYHASD